MQTLRDYFKSARTCSMATRKIGLEVETLFCDRGSAPITKDQSQVMMNQLVACGWTIAESKQGMTTKLVKSLPGRGDFFVFYELGWNNVEVVTPTYSICDRAGLLQDVRGDILPEVYEVSPCGPLGDYCDFSENEDTLMLPDQRDQIWLKLDGDVLPVLGHIASVHINIDLCSIAEGFEFMRLTNQMYRQMDWPPKVVADIWSRYIGESLADYEVGRYGLPPGNFEDYISRLSGYKVFMNTLGGQLSVLSDPKPFCDTSDVDLDMFLRSVWWWNRLRVRNGQLVLEIRGIPRGSDDQMVVDCQDLFSLLKL
jgi:hypothetical protein